MSRIKIGQSSGRGLVKTLLWSGALEVTTAEYSTIVFDEDLSGFVCEVEFTVGNTSGATSLFGKVKIDSVSSSTSGGFDEAIYTYCSNGAGGVTEYHALTCGRVIGTTDRETDLKTLCFKAVDLNSSSGLTFVIKNIYKLVE